MSNSKTRLGHELGGLISGTGNKAKNRYQTIDQVCLTSKKRVASYEATKSKPSTVTPIAPNAPGFAI